MMNRIEELYETALKYLALSDMARYLIGTHFGYFSYDEFFENPNHVSEKIFVLAYKRDFVTLKLLTAQQSKGYTNGESRTVH